MSELALALIAKEKEAKTGSLDLGRCGLTQLPEELFALAHLEELTISNRYWDYEQRKWIPSQNKGAYNLLSGDLSSSFTRLSRLKTLRIGGSGSISDPVTGLLLINDFWNLKNITPLKELQQLNTLDLRSNKLSDISPLKELQQLNTLDLRYNKLSDISPLKELQQLNTLYLSDNNLSDISPLKELQQLNTLDLRSNKLSDISPLKELQQLNTLDLRYNKLSDISPLKELQQLNTLDLSSNNLSDISPLKELQQLNTLDLSYNNLSDISPLKELQQLNTLDLSDNKLSDISPLKELQQLNTLDLSDNKLSDISPLKELQQLNTLDLSDNKLSDISPLKELQQLNTLDLRSNKLSDISPLKELQQLNTLDLRSNKLSDISPLKELQQLNTLDLRYNKLSDISPLKELQQLNTLDLRYNKLSDISPLKELQQLNTLDLSYNNLSDISPLKELQQLNTLYLSDNNLSDISPLKELQQLNTLDLRYNKLSDISPLKELQQLNTLDLRSNKLSDISPLKELQQLNTLDLRSNKLSDISPLKELQQLNTLYLSDNNLSDISPLKELQQLNTLYLSSNNLSDISPLKELQQLNTLDLSDNKQIKDFSPLKELQQLNTLDLSYNNISDISSLLPLISKGIPLSLEKYNYQGKINLYENPITSPPLEIVRQGNAAVLNYFKEIEVQDGLPLYECKLLLIGEGGSGKTSLARKLINEGAELPKENESTQGIDIVPYHFTTTQGQDFRINIWDFGGQEIYHATHQYFLTKRSLYILLDDTRRDDRTVNDASFKYWLQVVELLSENSPLLIVQNEKGDRKKALDMKSMRGRFDNILGTKATNLLSCRSLAEVKTEIEHQVQQLPHVGEVLPTQWLLIREELEKWAEEKNWITIKEYFTLCAKHQIPEENRALQLSSYLHDLGAFLHFQDDFVLRDLFILKNTWATDAAYKVLDNEKVIAQFGQFTEADLQHIWKEKSYQGKHPQLLALMEKFQLCYPLHDTSEKTWLAPQLLPIETPEYEWDSTDNLNLRYEYDFMPKGLLSNFIVRMNRYVLEPDKAWRSGVFLERKNTQALVVEPYGDQEIIIRVKGALSKELMTLISEEIDKINESYGKKLRVRKMIPCNCSVCKNAEKTQFL